MLRRLRSWWQRRRAEAEADWDRRAGTELARHVCATNPDLWRRANEVGLLRPEDLDGPRLSEADAARLRRLWR